MVLGLPEIQISSEMCEECLQAKQHKNSFSKDAETTLEHLLKLYTLACLYYQVDSIGGNKYSVTFIDYFSIKFEHTWLKRKVMWLMCSLNSNLWWKGKMVTRSRY